MTTAKPEVFTRKASGLVRVMSPYSAFVYNILTMGLIFPWTYLWAPGALPGGKLVWGILLAMVIEIPIAYVYVWLSTALPRSGGDYVFQSRVFGGGVAFTVVMSGFVIWILQWVALSGWLVSYLGFAPLFLGLGATLGNASLSTLGVWFTTSTGIVVALACLVGERIQELCALPTRDVVGYIALLRHGVHCPVHDPCFGIRLTAQCFCCCIGRCAKFLSNRSGCSDRGRH
jgi:amino acid transporter